MLIVVPVTMLEFASRMLGAGEGSSYLTANTRLVLYPARCAHVEAEQEPMRMALLVSFAHISLQAEDVWLHIASNNVEEQSTHNTGAS